MNMDAVLKRVRVRIPAAEATSSVLKEYIQTVSDRLCLRLGADGLPEAFSSICVDATVKMFRRTYYEGISTEGVANISTSFVEDILAEYDQEISDWKTSRANSGGGSRKQVRFL